MNDRIPSRLYIAPLRAIPALAIAVLSISLTVSAADKIWDPGATGGSDGSGAWQTGFGPWSNGAPDSWNPNDSAIVGFGGAGPYTVTIDGAGVTANSLTFNSSGYDVTGGPLTLAGSASVTTIGNAGISAAIAGSAGLAKSGAGTLTLSGAVPNSYVGTTTLSVGFTAFSKNTNVTAVPGNLAMPADNSPTAWTVNNNQFAATTEILFSAGAGFSRLNLIGTSQQAAGISDASGRGVIQNWEAGAPNIGGDSTLVLSPANGASYAFNGFLRDGFNGRTLALTKAGLGEQVLVGSRIKYTGATTINAGTLRLVDTTDFNSNITNANANATVELGRTVNGFGARGSITKQISGTGTLNVNNTTSGINGGWTTFISASSGLSVFSGTVNVMSGVLSMDNLNGAWSGNPDLNVSSGGLFAIRGQDISVDALTGDGDVFNSFNGSGAAGDTLTLGAVNGSGTFSGVIHGSNSAGPSATIDQGILNLVKTGSGTQTLTGSSTYSGTTTVNAGTLRIAGGGQLGSGSYAAAISLGAGTGVLDYNSSANQLLSGIISGMGSLRKDNTGILTVTGSNTYTGATNVLNGALVADGTHTGGGLYTIAPGAILGGSGTISAGVINNGTIAPGNSPGTLTVGSLTLGTYDWELFDATGAAGTDWDLIDVTGALTINAIGSAIDISGLSALPNTQGLPLNLDIAVIGNQTGPFTILTAGSIVGDFNDISLSFGNLGQYGTFSLDQVGNTLQLMFTSSVPEPSTYAIFALLLIGGGFFVRRQETKP